MQQDTAMDYPPDTAIDAAFELILDQIDIARRHADHKDKEELAYWRSQHNGFAKAQAHWIDGVRPGYTGAAYLVRSATRPDAIVHRVRRVGGVWVCSCEAMTFCWHTALIGAIDQAQDEAERVVTDADARAALDEVFV
jgi:hypothetical protein